MQNVIETSDLRFHYSDGEEIIAGLDLSVEHGEIFGLLGPSGSGKSTVQAILLGLLPDYTGIACVLGHEARRPPRAFYRQVGVSFELPANYLQLTAKENLDLFAALQGNPCRAAMDVLDDVGLSEHANQRVATFSKGMQMRLNLARALLHEPVLLFLDEPTSGQDPARARETRNMITTLKQLGRTILLTTHDMAEAELVCDRVGFLINGKMNTSGTPAELKRTFGESRLTVVHETEAGVVQDSYALDCLDLNERFLATLASNRIVSMHTAEASLDDVFVNLAKSE